MSEPTDGERALAARVRLDAAAVAAARDALNALAALSWPRAERVALLARLARAAKADVGEVLGGLALDAAPLAGFDALLPIAGLGDKRVAGLARALADFDPTKISADTRLQQAWVTIAALRAESATLRGELDRLNVRLATQGPDASPRPAPSVMRIADVATSVGSQVTLVDQLLRSRARGLRLGAVDLQLKGTGTATDGDVALDLGSPAGGSAVGLSFRSGAAEDRAAGETQVPDVGGYTTALAERKLLARGFAVAVANVAGGDGVVREQSPPASTLAPIGSVVRLLVR